MSQSQMDVRPAVQTMPLQGFHIQTGGSARRRIIRPTVKQTSTTQFPIQTHYNVSGIPGHTHNASVVCSVLCDLQRDRQVEQKSSEWSNETMTLQEGVPTDSEFIKDTDARLERALERGIGEICLRPENCHDEIREPVRSISELRTLVAPDDRLQCLTYVEEVGGFVNPDKTPYISDYPDVMINILGVSDPNRKQLPAAVFAPGGAGVGVAAPAPGDHFHDYPRLKQVRQLEDAKEGVFLHRADGADIGVLPDGSSWNGIVKFRWNASTRTYQSEGFSVSINRFHEVRQTAAAPANGSAQYTTLNEPGLQLYIYPMETTVASNGSCFLAADGLTNDQLFTSARPATATAPGNSYDMKPKIKVSVLSALPSRIIDQWELIGTPAVRIMVGGNHVFYGISELYDNFAYLPRTLNAVNPSRVASLLNRFRGGGYPTNAQGFTDYRMKYNGDHARATHNFGRSVANLQTQTALPVFSSPMNLETGAPWEGINLQFHDNVHMGHHMNYAAPPVEQGPDKWVVDMNVNATLLATTSQFDGQVYGVEVSQNKNEFAPADKDPNIPAYTGGVANTNSLDYFWENIDAYDHSTAVHQVQDSLIWTREVGRKIDFVAELGGPHIDAAYGDLVKNRMYCAYMRIQFFTDNEEYAFTAPPNVSFANPPVSIFFQVFTDAKFDGRVGFGPLDLSNLVRPTYQQDKRAAGPVYTDTAKPLFVHNIIHPMSRGAYNNDVALQGLGPDHLSQLVECMIPDVATLTNVVPQLKDGTAGAHMPTLFHIDNAGVWHFRDVVFNFPENRTIFLLFNDTENAGTDRCTTYFFQTAEATTEIRHSLDQIATVDYGHAVCTRVPVYKDYGDVATHTDLTTVIGNCLAKNKGVMAFAYLGKDLQQQFFANERLRTILTESNMIGPVFHSQKRISQHLCAPIVNPNSRIGCKSPLNYETMHLPPELRDFRLEMRNIDFSFLPGAAKMEDLVLYNFNGGNQVVASQPSMLHLPQFREFKTTAIKDDGSFDFEMFSPYGMPSYIAVFARDTDMTLDHMDQPLIKQLSIMCNTTMKKSNTILNANVHQLYHITQRNVNARARYNRHTFNKRQTILLSAEDIGLMGLRVSEYQREKRALFRFHGTVDQKARITVVLIYNNRALHVFGKQLRVVRLTEKNNLD